MPLVLAVLTACQSTEAIREENTANPSASTTAQQMDKLSAVIANGLQKRAAELEAPAMQVAPNGEGCTEGSYQLRDLAFGEVSISNQEVSYVASLVNVMGYNTIRLSPEGGAAATSFTCADLPVIVMPNEVNDEQITMRPTDGGGGGGAGTGNLLYNTLRKANAGDMDRLMVFYHPSETGKYTQLKKLIIEKIDLASPQVYLETLVMEINEEDSKELGIQYERAKNNKAFSLGLLDVKGGSTATFDRDTRKDDGGVSLFTADVGIRFQLKALVEKGRAEILSRPSVLALSNRQAIIQIVDVIQTPRLTSTLSDSGNIVISGYDFEPLLLGITLNMRPRVSADRQWVNLEIDATVETENDENTGEAFAPDPTGGQVLLAEKTGSSSRKVRTFARIPDRTPIIIGGLVAGTKEKNRSKVPVLGDIPIIGDLLGAKDNEVQKREVIIVLTPHVLSEDGISVKTNRPTDNVLFSQKNTVLFKNKYHVKEGDLFDLDFLFSDANFINYHSKAITLARNNPELENKPVIKAFVEGELPGGDILATKTVSDILARDDNKYEMDRKKVFLQQAGTDGLSLVSLHDVLDDMKDSFGKEKKLVISFQRKPASNYWAPHYTMEDMTASVTAGNDEHEKTIVLKSETDIEDLLHAIMTSETLKLNGGREGLALSSLSKGRMLLLPTTHNRDQFIVSSDTIDAMHNTRFYFGSFVKVLSHTYKDIDGLAAL